MREKISSLYKKNIVKVVIINLIIVLGTFLFFEPTMKSDDYDMSNLLYGGVSGDYSAITLYGNVLFYGVLKGLLILFPNVAWYAVSQYILIVLALITIDYLMLELHPNGIYMYILFSAFCSYEFIIRLTFTKTAGLLMACGYLVILVAIEYSKNCLLAIGFVYIVLGMLIRGGSEYFFLMISLVYSSSFLIFCYRNYHNSKMVQGMVKFVGCTIALFLICLSVNKINRMVILSTPGWENYFETNRARAGVTDYNLANYNLYAEEYEELGISQNDYRMWFSQGNRADSQRLTIDLYNEISQIKNVKDRTWRENFQGMCKELLSYLNNNTVFFCLLISIISFIGNEYDRKKRNIVCFVMGAIFLICYARLYIGGRLEHHVDACLLISFTLLFIYYNGFENAVKRSKSRMGIAVSLVIAMFVLNFYSELSYASYYTKSRFAAVETTQKELYEENYKALSVISNDKAHMYVVEPLDAYKTYVCFTPTEIIPKGFYSNIYRTNMNHVDVYENNTFDYVHSNLYDEMVNSNKIFYAISGDSADYLNITLTYIRENYDSDAQMKLVKNVGTIDIYRVYNHEFQLSEEEIEEIDDSIECNAAISVGENSINIMGTVSQTDTNIFSQNVYIKIYDIETGETDWYFTVQGEDGETDDDSYSKFKCEISDIGKYEQHDLEIEVILENENGIFRCEKWN